MNVVRLTALSLVVVPVLTQEAPASGQMLASYTTPRDWQVGMMDGTTSFKIRDNTAATDRMTISGSGTVTGTSIQANDQDVAECIPEAVWDSFAPILWHASVGTTASTVAARLVYYQ